MESTAKEGKTMNIEKGQIVTVKHVNGKVKKYKVTTVSKMDHLIFYGRLVRGSKVNKRTDRVHAGSVILKVEAA